MFAQQILIFRLVYGRYMISSDKEHLIVCLLKENTSGTNIYNTLIGL